LPTFILWIADAVGERVRTSLEGVGSEGEFRLKIQEPQGFAFNADWTCEISHIRLVKTRTKP
jgi:hypothetical protein